MRPGLLGGCRETALSTFGFDAARTFEQASKHGYDSVQCLLARAGAVRAVGDLDQAEELLKTAAALEAIAGRRPVGTRS